MEQPTDPGSREHDPAPREQEAIAANAKLPGFFYRKEGRITVATALGAATLALFIFGFYYLKYARLIDRRLTTGPFSDSINVYAAPRTIAVGEPLTQQAIVARLRQSGYSTVRENPVGWYNVRADAVEIFPGRNSYTGGGPAVIHFTGGRIARIVSLEDNTTRNEFLLEPALLTNLSDNNEKRRLVHFADLPPVLVNAVTSVEDKRFFHHTGFDLFRIAKAAYVDLKTGRKEQGASTLSMQLARGLWLEPDKRWKRKLEEFAITMHLEEKLSKQQIFEDYANQVYLGRRGPFSINGFGEAARSYFGKDLSQLTAAEAALLAGMIQRPSYYNPYRYPDRAMERRNVTLALMRQNRHLSESEYRAACAAPIKLAPEHSESLDTSYFLDVVNEELQAKFEDREHATRSVFTTLDSDLQAAAEEAVQVGMEGVDQLLKKRKAREGFPQGEPQVALIALDPHTGEIRALVGGRNYAASQLNHVLAMRQPGSVFKPFVYAAALNTAVAGGNRVFTPASVVDDSPTTFSFGRETYSPSNFNQEFMGDVTLRTALAHSLNVATVKLAEEIGYDKVVSLATRAGLNSAIQPTPAVALGSYDTTPLEIARAYTVFANQGSRVDPSAVAMVRTRAGRVLYEHQAAPQRTLDPRVNYLLVNMMQEVLRTGTGAAVRSRGFTLPAAGKTGTSRDGWFAGFTSQLLCLVWVGFDDGRNLDLEGAKSALPIWAEFMKRAAKFRQYKDAKPFTQPAGIVQARICTDSGELAGPTCPRTRSDVFIEGTQPTIECQLHSLDAQSLEDRLVAPLDSTVTTPSTFSADRSSIQ